MNRDVWLDSARGFRVESTMVRTHRLDEASLSETVRHLDDRKSLVEVPFALLEGDSALPFVLAYATRRGARPIGGFLVLPVGEGGADPHRPPSPMVVSKLCSILSRMSVLDAMPSEAFAEVALALRVACGSGQQPLGNEKRRGLTERQSATAIRLLGEQLLGDFSLSAIAEACRMSERDLSRAFRHTHGMTIHRWRKRQRIELAKHMLAGSSLPIAEVAVACGFREHVQFLRAFASFEGMPPRAWRRSAPDPA